MTEKWNEFDIEDKITEIMRDLRYDDPKQYGEPFFTTYQLAIEFAKRYPKETSAIGKPIGGKSTGQETSLAQYFAQVLYQKISTGRIRHIEAARLNHFDLQEMRFEHNGSFIQASQMEVGFPVTIFRLKE